MLDGHSQVIIAHLEALVIRNLLIELCESLEEIILAFHDYKLN